MKPEDQPVEEPLSGAAQPFDIPIWFRWFIGGVAALLIAAPVAFMIRYSVAPKDFVSPAELGMVQILLLGAFMLLIAVAPWRALRLRVNKVGFVEFGQVVDAQAKENAEEFSELLARIEELETKVRGLDEIAPISEHLEDLELIPLLSQYLENFAPTAFSPTRIKEWGSRQAGFEKLKSYRQGAIRRVLQKLVAQGKAATRVSRMGATLYKQVD